MDARRFLKAVLGLVVLVGLLVLVLTWWGDYRATRSVSGVKSKDSTSTPAPSNGSQSATEGAMVAPETALEPTSEPRDILIVQVAGLNFRQEPSSASKAYRGLKKGEKVVLLEEEGDWYKVQDASGLVGYITSSPTYTEKSQE